MIAQYRELLESFKEHQISKLIDKINSKIFAALNALKNPKFNPRIAPYFTKINESGPPFTDYELDPDNVSQIKKLLNALYYARLAFIDLENIDLKQNLNKSLSELKFLYDKTINIGYEACYLATHLDVDIQDMFQEEFDLLFHWAGKIRTVVKQNEESTKLLAETLKEYPLSYKIGEVTGIALEKAHPSSGDLDYDFLTQFSAILPSYIDKVTEFIKQYSSQLIEQEPTLNNEKLEELQNTALKLLNDIENLKGGSFFISLKFLNYVHIIRNIITLAMSSLEQMGNLSDSSQDLIRDNIAQLKYIILPQLFGLVDKIEVNTMLKPGTLSIPLMNKIKPLYQILIHYASKPVNFKENGEELLSIEDSRFLSLRLEQTYQRIDKANKAIFKIQKAQEASTSFYKLLNEQQYKDVVLHTLPPEVKAKLIADYKILKPYMMQVDIDLHEQITASLIGGETWSNYLTKPWWGWVKKQLPPDHVSFILAKQIALDNLITKKHRTQLFHIEVNTQLIESVQQETDLTLFPYSDNTSIITIDEPEKGELVKLSASDKENLYLIDESQILTNAEENSPNIEFDKEKEANLVVNPEQLSADQALVLYQWYKGKQNHFTQAKNAYNEFITLLAQELKENTHTPNHVFTFNHLDPESKLKCRKLYMKFQAYFIAAVPEELKSQALIFEKFLNPEPSDQPSTAAAPVIIEFELLNTHFQSFFNEIDSKWTKRTQFYLQQAQHKFASDDLNVFKVDEARALRANGAFTPSLKFIKEKGNKLVEKPKQLTADQALCLYQWYRNKLNKFEVARNAYYQFCALLNDQAKKVTSAKGSKLTLAHLDKGIKAECRKLYNLFQPYFINGVPEKIRQEALAFDRFLAHSFADEAPQKNTPTIDMFEKLDEHFQIFFTEIDLSWRKKSQSYLKCAKEKFEQENESAVFEYEASDSRAHHLIKHTNYSKFLYEFRQTLQKLTTLFNKPMQAELKIHFSSGVPFPELEDKNKAAMQSRQVLAIKQIYNTLYHIEHIVRQLEKLNDRSSKSKYLYHLIGAYSHIHQIIKLAKSLATDSHFSLISRELLDKAQNMWAAIQENIEAYQVGPGEVPTSGAVKFNALWYTLNAFYVIPKHIRSLRNNTFLSVQELDDLHLSAKKANLKIEAIIASSDSYFKLFLQAPNMILLYRELKGKLTEFIGTSHDSVIDNLDQFNANVFTPMLIEADNWEDKLGLAPGTFSGPLKKIIDEYYKGLLKPLKLPSKTHLQFVCDKTPIEQRILTTQQKIDDADAHLVKLEKNYAKINKLLQLIDKKEKISNDVLIRAFKVALPRLVGLQKLIQFEPAEKMSDDDLAFDAKLNASLKEYDPKIVDIQGLIKAGNSHYIGLKNTYQMKLNTAKEKLAYLVELNIAQDKANTRFIEEYTTESFNKQLNELANRHIGLQYTDKEYSAKLDKYLQTFKETIIEQAKTAEDINQTVKDLLKEKIRLFEKDKFTKHYQLDTIRVALAQFKNYFSISALAIEQNNSLFENDRSLAKKTSEINKLVLIAENESIQIEDRINQIKTQVIGNPSFNRTILENRQFDHFNFAYLKFCILSLLEALYLYTPEKKARLNDLKRAVTTEPQITELTKRFGLFTTTSTSQTQLGNDEEELDTDLESDELPFPTGNQP